MGKAYAVLYACNVSWIACLRLNKSRLLVITATCFQIKGEKAPRSPPNAVIPTIPHELSQRRRLGTNLEFCDVIRDTCVL